VPHALSLLIFLPLLGLLAFAVWPQKGNRSGNKLGSQQALGVVMGILVAQLGFFLAVLLPEAWQALPRIGVTGSSFFRFESTEWLTLQLGSFGILKITYQLGLDGLNILLVALTLIVLLIAVGASWGLQQRPVAFAALILLLDTSLLGCFLAQDLFLFFLFYEFMLLPLFFLIGLWGSARSSFAALKFFLYTLVGSVFLLVVMVALFFSSIDPLETAIELGRADSLLEARRLVPDILAQLKAGTLPSQAQVHSLSLPVLLQPEFRIPGSWLSDTDARLWAFGGLFIAFAVKLPVVPIHTWLPDAHVEASTPVSVILAGVLLKVGGYGLIRLCYGLFPEAGVALASWVGLVAMISALYPALIALAQTDLKRMIAYSSISHMGFALLGIASLKPEGIDGAIFQFFNHGIISAALFLIAGTLQNRVGDRNWTHFQGLWGPMPWFATVAMVTFFAALGLPGFSAFVSELLVFTGAFAVEGNGVMLPRGYVVASMAALILAAGYFLRSYRRLFFGPFETLGGESWTHRLTDLSLRERALFVPLLLLMLLPGILPQVFLQFVEGTAALWTEAIRRAAEL